jgi:molecular chaperone DnaK
VLSKTGLTDVGGKEMDEAIGEIILSDFNRVLGRAVSLTARSLLELRRASEQIKISLCMPGRTSVKQTVLLGSEALDITVRKLDFENRIRSLIERTEQEVLRCVKDAGLGLRDVDAVLLVGGSSMAPAVSENLKRIFDSGQRILFHEPSKAVALGAALHASQLSGEAKRHNIPPEFRGVTGACVGVRAIDPQSGRVTVDTLIKRNMPLPVNVKKSYYTTRDNQDRIVLDFVQFQTIKDPFVSIGQLVVGPLPSPRRNYAIEVTVENREDSTISVQAYDANTGVELSQVFGRQEARGPENLAAQRALVRSTFINNL